MNIISNLLNNINFIENQWIPQYSLVKKNIIDNEKFTEHFKNNDKYIASFLTLLGIPGDLLARAIYKKGSIDKPYLFLFGIPPFSIIPTIFMFSNNINEGENEKPIDKIAIIGSVLLFGIPLLLLFIKNKIQNKYINDTVIKLLISIVSFLIIFVIYKIKYKYLSIYR